MGDTELGDTITAWLLGPFHQQNPSFPGALSLLGLPSQQTVPDPPMSPWQPRDVTLASSCHGDPLEMPQGQGRAVGTAVINLGH